MDRCGGIAPRAHGQDHRGAAGNDVSAGKVHGFDNRQDNRLFVFKTATCPRPDWRDDALESAAHEGIVERHGTVMVVPSICYCMIR